MCVARGGASRTPGEQPPLVNAQHVHVVERVFLAVPVADDLQVLGFAQLRAVAVVVLVELDDDKQLG